ncbi:MAG: hypothetical protein GX493_01285 [Firmicutes bacterium]|nr:hypothetical protein [Bacillota bacterium]
MVRINLLPPEYRPQPQIQPLRLLLLLGLILGPLILAGVGAYCWYQLYTLDREIADLTAERAQYGPLYDKVIGMEKKLGELEQQLAAREKLTADHLNAVEILTTLSRMVPKNVVINSLTVGAGGSISISATAGDYFGAAAFQLRLIKSEEFTPAVLGGASGEEGNISFQLTTAFRKAGGGGGVATPVVTASPSSSSSSGTRVQGGAPPAADTGEGAAPSSRTEGTTGTGEGAVF